MISFIPNKIRAGQPKFFFAGIKELALDNNAGLNRVAWANADAHRLEQKM